MNNVTTAPADIAISRIELGYDRGIGVYLSDPDDNWSVRICVRAVKRYLGRSPEEDYPAKIALEVTKTDPEREDWYAAQLVRNDILGLPDRTQEKLNHGCALYIYESLGDWLFEYADIPGGATFWFRLEAAS